MLLRRVLRGSFPRFSSTLAPLDTFSRRHIGPQAVEIDAMVSTLGLSSVNDLVQKALPSSIHIKNKPALGDALSETETLSLLKSIAKKNVVAKSYIGLGYTGTITPPVILRNILENPQWYTQYTPYQPEISQGRLESLINFQTMIQDLTGLPFSNASLLDEGTAAAEGMLLAFASHNRKRKIFLVDSACYPQTIACVKTRAEPLGIQVIVADYQTVDLGQYKDQLMGTLFQYPSGFGEVRDYEHFVKKVHDLGGLVVCAADLLSLALLKPPGEFGVDVAVGSAQRFGVPMGFGGPHAAFFAVKDALKRRMPGRLVGVSKDAHGKRAYRLALQTREQHIRREKATSNICTAQALLANMAAMYAVYHGPKGIKNIASRVHHLAKVFSASVQKAGYSVKYDHFFDTVVVKLPYEAKDLVHKAEEKKINVRVVDNYTVSVTFDESVTANDLQELVNLFVVSSLVDVYIHGDSKLLKTIQVSQINPTVNHTIPQTLQRTSRYLTHPVFNSYHSETEMLRYITQLQKKDLSLADAMIPLGSCTMKLNATTEMIPVTWPEFSNIHPFAPEYQTRGYQRLLAELEYALEQATGFADVSLQPNSGAQGEYAGLRCIMAYLESIGQGQRNVCLIPVSAHGTNPASAAMAGMQVITVKCEENGNLDIKDLKEKAAKHANQLAAIMITYPSTYGVFEDHIKEICNIVHQHGGQVYMDGANLNAQMGLCSPGEIGADVCHLNLHKTFCIPHGGGGPGMGPIGVQSHLAPFLPGHPLIKTGGEKAIGPMTSAPFGSASILPISWSYLKMMGENGLRKATEVALLNANYMMKRLAPHYPILFTNKNGMCAHEFIIDCRGFGETANIEAIDIAKRLHDYGFHSPTMSFPVANTLMVEPTESESKEELDRFCDSMISIREEIRSIEQGKQPKENNALKNAPHSLEILMGDEWNRPYTRSQAAYPMPNLRQRKFFPSVSRLDDSYGDRNLMCSCPPMEDYEQS